MGEKNRHRQIEIDKKEAEIQDCVQGLKSNSESSSGKSHKTD